MKYIFVIVFAQIVFLTIGILIGVFEKKTCLSQCCKDLSNDIKRNLDTSIDPCDDFYQFTCGKVVNGSGSKSNGILVETAIAQLVRVLRLLQQGLQPGEPEAYAKAKTIFKKCTEDDESEVEAVRKIRNLFLEIGGFPLLQGDKWNEAGWNWLETSRSIRELGLFYGSLFRIELVINPLDHSTSLGILNPEFPDFQPCANSRQECQTIFDTSFTGILEYGVSKKQAEEVGEEIFGLEWQLFELSKNHTSIEVEKLNKNSGRDLTNMTASFGYIDWPKFLGIMLQKDGVPNSFKIIVLNPGYMEGLQTIFEHTSKKVMANYMMWKVLQVSVWKYSLHPGKKAIHQCFAFVQDTMGFVLTPLYLEKYPDPRGSDLNLIWDMVDLLKDDVLAAIKRVDWMSDQVKEKSTRKIKLLKQRIGDLKVLNKSFVEDFYRGLSVEGGAFEAMMSVNKFVMDKTFEMCDGWSATFVTLAALTAFQPNAFYVGLDNSFNVLHSLLQKPVYDADWPWCVNYGRIGSIVGHEITHALDESGHLYDEHGDLADTWDEDTYRQFNKTSQCLADQFDSFYNVSPSSSPHRSGSYKSLENMADTGGSKLAFLAYRNYTDKRFWPDFLLPDLDYTPNQLFFISYALFWCSKADETRLALDSHSAARYRVLKTLRNNPHFARAFGCRRGHGMTSGIKCDVW